MPFVLLVFRLPLNMSGQEQRRIVVSFPIAGPQIYGAADLAGDSIEGFFRVFKKKFDHVLVSKLLAASIRSFSNAIRKCDQQVSRLQLDRPSTSTESPKPPDS